MENSNFLKSKQRNELEKLTAQLRDKVEVKDKFALNIIKKTRKNIQKIYKDFSFGRDEIDLSDMDLDDLINKKLLAFISKKENKLTVTFKAVLIVEYKITNFDHNLDRMLDDLNDEFFESVMDLSIEPLTSLEKAVLLALIGLGALSEQYPLEVNEQNQTDFKKAIDCAVKFIRGLGPNFIDKSLDTLWSKKVVGETPIIAEMRRLNKLQPRTEGIYKVKAWKNYLDIITDEKFNEDKIVYILTRIFDKEPLSYDKKEDLIKTLDEIQDYEIKLFTSAPPFDSFEIRQQIKRIIYANYR